MAHSRVAPLFGVLLALARAAPQECQRGQDEDAVSALQTSYGHTHASQSYDPAPAPSPNAPCPYEFSPPKCEDAEVQSPRDLLPGAVGHRIPKAATLTDMQAEFLPLANIHFHLGAEHRSAEYADSADSWQFDHAENPEGPRPGWMCDACDLPAPQLEPYEFEHCEDYVQVGKTYEIHWVHSSAGYTADDINGSGTPALDDGLGGAANGRGQLNPMIAVDGQVVMITNGGTDELNLKATRWAPDYNTSVMYPGSTTGTSFNNSVCSPYAITWHVDTRCYKVTARTFDRFCEEMKNKFGLMDDLSAHSSRVLVDPAWVAQSQWVLPLA